MVVGQILAGQLGQSRTHGSAWCDGAGVEPSEESSRVVERAADPDRGGVFLSGGQWPGQHGVAQLLGVQAVTVRDEPEVEDQRGDVLLQHGRFQPPHVVTEPGGLSEHHPIPQPPTGQHEVLVAGQVVQLHGDRGQGCSHGSSASSSNASAGLVCPAERSSAGVNFGSTSRRMAAQTGP